MIFKERIKEAIKMCKLSQKEIAKKLQISESNISMWKKGTSEPSIETLYNLCIILDVSADYLLGLKEYY